NARRALVLPRSTPSGTKQGSVGRAIALNSAPHSNPAARWWGVRGFGRSRFFAQSLAHQWLTSRAVALVEPCQPPDFVLPFQGLASRNDDQAHRRALERARLELRSPGR